MRSFYLLSLTIFVASMVNGCAGCTEQHRPEGHWEKLQKEREIAHAKLPQLNKDGSLVDAGAEQVVDAAQLYQNYCASCHGAQGAGDGPAGMALNPKPRNLTDVAWQESVDDERIYTVLEKGGTAIGISATMAPWGGVMNDKEITAMVEYIRTLKGS